MILQQTASVSRNICGIFATEVAEKEDIRSLNEQWERKSLCPTLPLSHHFNTKIPLEVDFSKYFSVISSSC